CAMVSATFAFAALAVHLRRATGDATRRRARDGWVEGGLWALAFAAGEYALCGAAYAIAYARVGRAAEWRGGARALLLVVGALACAAGEYALCGGAYAIAYALVGRAAEWRVRLRALLPVAVVLLGFVIASVAMRAGVHGATSYVDPLGHPLEFVLASVDRVP